MPEGDTIHYAAHRIRPVLEGHVPDELAHAAPALRARPLAGAARRPRRHARRRPRQAPVPALRGRPHPPLAPADDRRLGRLRRAGAAWRRAPRRGLARARRGDHDVVAVRRPRARADDRRRARASIARIAGLGPDILAPELDERRFLRRLREDDPTRPIGDALLDQRTIAGIGNLWKCEGCCEARDRSLAADRRRHRRRGRSRCVARRAAAHAGVRARTACGAPPQARLRPRRAPCPRCGTTIRVARPGRRQPHDILVPGMPALSAARAAASASATRAPTSSRPATRSRPSTRRSASGVDMIEFDVLPEHLDGAGAAAARARLRGRLAARRRRRSRRASPTSPARRYAGHRARRRPQAARLRGARRSRRCASTASPSAR